MKTLSEVITWLSQPDHISIILVEVESVSVGGSPTTLYLSTKPFTSTATDTPANKYYEACIRGGLSFNETIDLEGAASIGFGDLEVDNTNGVRDSWLNYIWANRTIKAYIGDPRWTRNDYYLIFTGVVSDLISRDLNTLNIVLLNKLEKLNRPISETTLGGTSNNKDRLKPLLFGECFNIEPLRTYPTPESLEYMVHDGAIEDILEVRDNGLPVSITKSIGTGTFTLNQSPYGTITASVQGSKPTTYYDNAAELIKNIVKNYGPANTRFTDSDISLTNFSSFASANTQSLGIYISDTENVLDVCQNLAASIGASLVVTHDGLLKLVKLEIPGAGSYTTIYPEDILFEELYIADRPFVKAAVKLNYCKNWRTQEKSSLAGAVLDEHIPIMEEEWYSSTAEDATVKANYLITDEPEAIDTLLVNSTEATTEATRRLNIWKSPRSIVNVTCFAKMLTVELGDFVTIVHPRYGYTSGVNGIVISATRDWVAGTATLGVLI